MNAVVDVPALIVSVFVALAITVTLMLAHRGDNHRRGWLAAGGISVVLIAIGLIDLLRATPRETNLGAVVVGIALPVVGALGMIRATRRVRPWVRCLMVFFTAYALLFGGLLIGATVASRLFPI
jgi:hypothetical protein